jgi:hypothetical protein
MNPLPSIKTQVVVTHTVLPVANDVRTLQCRSVHQQDTHGWKVGSTTKKLESGHGGSDGALYLQSPKLPLRNVHA